MVEKRRLFQRIWSSLPPTNDVAEVYYLFGGDLTLFEVQKNVILV